MLSFLYGPTLTSICDYWKSHSLTRWTFVGKVIFLLFNMSRLVIAFLPRSKHLLISWLQSPSTVILEPKKIKSVIVSPSISHEVRGLDAIIFIFWMLSFKPAFSLCSFTYIKRLFSSFPLSAIRVVLSAHLRLLIFLLEILIPACASFSPAVCMMYFAYKLNKQGDSIQPLLLSNFEPVQCFMSGSKFCFLVSLLLWVSQEAGKVVWYSHPFRNFP